jgi:hypothetical protein
MHARRNPVRKQVWRNRAALPVTINGANAQADARDERQVVMRRNGEQEKPCRPDMPGISAGRPTKQRPVSVISAIGPQPVVLVKKSNTGHPTPTTKEIQHGKFE